MPLATCVHFFLGELATLRTRVGSDSWFTTLAWQSPSAWMDGASGSYSYGSCYRKARGHCGNVQDRIRKSKNSIFVFFFFFFLNKDLLCEVSRFVFFFFPNKWNWAQSYMASLRWRLLIKNHQGSRGCRLVLPRCLVLAVRFPLFCRFYYASAAPVSGKGFLPFL